MKSFLLLSIREEPEAAREEHDAFVKFLEVPAERVVRRPLGVAGLGPVDLDDWSGIVLGGGAFCVSDPEDAKSPGQRRAEEDLAMLLDRVVAADFPFLGACYGIGTEEGHLDPLFVGVPPTFAAYGGHKEALSVVPSGAVVLATSPACPVQGFRVGSNVYATQFHPELDLPGIITRIAVYAGHGYFDPAEVAALQARAAAVHVSHPGTLLRNFARLHTR